MKKSFNEKFFDFPRFYEWKAKIITRLNCGFTDFATSRLEKLTTNKEVVDIGCGSTQLFYDPNKTKKRLGVDISAAMIEDSKKLYPSSSYIVSAAEDLELPPKSFDAVLFCFFLHHVDPKAWPKILEKARGIARESVVILDHTLNDSLIPRSIQKLWWNLFDGGRFYPREEEWDALLKNFKIIEYQRKGALFGNVCYYNLTP